jgi:hypothetical protein
MIRLLFLLVTFWQITPLMAAAQKPPELSTRIKSMRPYGEAKFTKLLWDIYDISLWTDADVWSRDKPYAITIHYMRPFTADQLVDKTIEEMKRLGAPFNPENYRKKLEELFPNVNEGDRITAFFKPSLKVTFFFNGSDRGNVNNVNFAKYFSDIWLSPETEEPEVREELLKINK